MYHNSALIPVGKCKVQLEHPNLTKKFKVPFTIVDDQDVKSNLLRCSTVQSMGLIHITQPDDNGKHVNNLTADPPQNNALIDPSLIGFTLQDIQDEYREVLKRLGTLGPDLHLETAPNTPPMQIPPRKIPEALKPPLRNHLDKLVLQGVIEQNNFPTEWVSSIVVNRKPNGKLRLCIDP